MKPTLFAVGVTVLVAAMQPFAVAADTPSTSETNTNKTPEASEKNPTATSDLAIENIQDMAYTLERIRQQAINIYIECTRKPVRHFALNIVSLSTMPTTALENQNAYLPLRKAWLVFFIGTMEPLVQILNEHIKHIDENTKKRNLPSQCLPQWHIIVSEWTNSIKQLNAQLDLCAAMVNDCSQGNVEVAKSAKLIDHEVTQLDGILHRASKFLHDNSPVQQD